MVFDGFLKVYLLFFNPLVFKNMIELVNFVKSLDKVESDFHKYGGISFLINNREFCHIHGDGLVDIILTTAITKGIYNLDGFEKHHVLGESNWVSYQITKYSLEEVKQVIILATKIKYNYGVS